MPDKDILLSLGSIMPALMFNTNVSSEIFDDDGYIPKNPCFSDQNSPKIAILDSHTFKAGKTVFQFVNIL